MPPMARAMTDLTTRTRNSARCSTRVMPARSRVGPVSAPSPVPLRDAFLKPMAIVRPGWSDRARCRPRSRRWPRRRLRRRRHRGRRRRGRRHRPPVRPSRRRRRPRGRRARGRHRRARSTTGRLRPPRSPPRRRGGTLLTGLMVPGGAALGTGSLLRPVPLVVTGSCMALRSSSWKPELTRRNSTDVLAHLAGGVGQLVGPEHDEGRRAG